MVNWTANISVLLHRKKYFVTLQNEPTFHLNISLECVKTRMKHFENSSLKLTNLNILIYDRYKAFYDFQSLFFLYLCVLRVKTSMHTSALKYSLGFERRYTGHW